MTQTQSQEKQLFYVRYWEEMKRGKDKEGGRERDRRGEAEKRREKWERERKRQQRIEKE